ncbi:arylsulfatase B-like [Branchiostoma lanceolatum]|uniref:arylsulfatase B-like n=1 Tax=Branchiostoma lanceolatum TaxID=7740 RepID=UPI00345168D1
MAQSASRVCAFLSRVFSIRRILHPLWIFVALSVLILFAGLRSLNTGYLIVSDRRILEDIRKTRGETTQKTSQTGKPNIVFILADDYGWNDIGYHSSLIHTPNLDRLAQEGVKLENYYIQPICSPSRAQLMTGRYQIRYGMQHSVLMSDRPHGLSLDEVTLPQVLKESGYATHLVGKWHLGHFKEEYLPTRRGFDTFYGFLGGGEDYFTHRIPNEIVETPETYRAFDFWDGTSPCLDVNGTYSTHLFARKSIELISRHDKNKPMFLYLPFQAVHAPLEAPEEYINKYSHIKSRNMRVYAGVTAAMDEAVGNVTQALKDSGMWDNTVLIFSTDNGASRAGSNWPLRGFKTTLWEGGVRGVGFVNSPLLKVKERTSDALLHISDWFPTIVRLAGGSTFGTKPLDGYDVWDTISEGASSPRNEILHNIDPLTWSTNSEASKIHGHGTFNTAVKAAIRVGDWKLLTGNPGNGDWQLQTMDGKIKEKSAGVRGKQLWLFNIRNDPQERKDVSGEYPEVVQRLLGRLSAYNETAVPVYWPDIDPRSNPALHGDLVGPWM